MKHLASLFYAQTIFILKFSYIYILFQVNIDYIYLQSLLYKKITYLKIDICYFFIIYQLLDI